MFPWNEQAFWDLGGLRHLGGLVTAGFGSIEKVVGLIGRAPFRMEILADAAGLVLDLAKRAYMAAVHWFQGLLIDVDDLPLINTRKHNNIAGGEPGEIQVDVLVGNSNKEHKDDRRLTIFSIDRQQFEREFWAGFRSVLEEAIRNGDDTVSINDLYLPNYDVFVPISLWRSTYEYS